MWFETSKKWYFKLSVGDRFYILDDKDGSLFHVTVTNDLADDTGKYHLKISSKRANLFQRWLFRLTKRFHKTMQLTNPFIRPSIVGIKIW